MARINQKPLRTKLERRQYCSEDDGLGFRRQERRFEAPIDRVVSE